MTPFAVTEQLYQNLEIAGSQIKQGQNSDELYLPENPRVQLRDTQGITDYLKSELITTDLDELAPHLWMVAKQDSKHVSTLTEQIVRGRNLVVTEKPELHLVWFDNRVFIKPLPRCLLSHVFWEYYLTQHNPPRIEETVRQSLVRAAYGLLRSYAFLIKHESDFGLAIKEENGLIPKTVSYPNFIKFIDHFQVTDDQVSPRYHFGELRLTRLNFWTRIFLWKFNYHKVEWAYGAYFARYYAPILFVFGVISVLLSAVQVAFNVLTIQGIPTSGHSSWWTFVVVSRNFSIFTLVFAIFVTAFLVAALVALSVRELVFALYHMYRKRHPEYL
ncbi:hypothetical protein ACMFMG_010470 [Clarireedia jacksonii]